MFQPAFEERNISFVNTELADLPIICADKDLLYKVFYHVIGNAIKYTPGGEILICAEKNPAHPDLTVEIKDTGTGIPSAMISGRQAAQRIMERLAA